MSIDLSDAELLKRYEPVLKFTRGERFFPMDSAPYINACSLWMRRQHEADECIIEQGQLTQEHLTQPLPDDVSSTSYYLKLTEPISPAEVVARELRKISTHPRETDTFHIGKGRLSRVGYMSRIIDALFSISLLTRGRVRGDTAAAAEKIYDGLMQPQDKYSYHGRVVRQSGWIILQYWFFYAYNNWRSGFAGANDHEADWESIHIYLYPDDRGEIVPEWVTYASHYEEGDDIRRHWDDPELEKYGLHPVVYVAAGSHASYYKSGEYLPEVELQFLSLPARLMESILNIWHRTLRQYRVEKPGQQAEGSMRFFRVPFVDYARGDGLWLGAEQEKNWDDPVMLNPPPGWVTNYQGLWGLDAHDPFGGENAPGGPMYHQDGSVRRIWFDPAGWAGLDKVPPPNLRLQRALESIAEVKDHISAVQEEIEEKHHQLELLGIKGMAMQQRPYLEELYRSHIQKSEGLSQELNLLGAELSESQNLLDAMEIYSSGLQSGKKIDLRSHLSRPTQPVTQENLRLGKLGEFWAAASVSIMLLGIVALYFFARHSMFIGFFAFLLLFLFLEASFRGWLTQLITTITILLTLTASLVLLFEFFWQTITVAVLLFGAYILWENLRELWS